MEFSEESYDGMIKDLFVRFPSYQKSGAEAYKPGIANMEFFDQLVGHPHRKYPSVHVAGTNGKGSVCKGVGVQHAGVCPGCRRAQGRAVYISPYP